MIHSLAVVRKPGSSRSTRGSRREGRSHPGKSFALHPGLGQQERVPLGIAHERATAQPDPGVRDGDGLRAYRRPLALPNGPEGATGIGHNQANLPVGEVVGLEVGRRGAPVSRCQVLEELDARERVFNLRLDEQKKQASKSF